jgi:hypothetical protein
MEKLGQQTSYKVVVTNFNTSYTISSCVGNESRQEVEE